LQHVVIPTLDVRDGSAATVYDRLRTDKLRRFEGYAPLFSPALRVQLERGLVDSARVPRIVLDDADGNTLELPGLTTFGLAHWLDPTVPAVPLDVGAVAPAAALELVAHLHACAGGDDVPDAGHAVATALATGLQQRLGRHLSDSELSAYHTLVWLAEGVTAGVRVCEGCWVVFAAPRARFCHRCHRNPPRSSARIAASSVHAGDRRHPDTRVTIVGATVVVHGWRARAGTPSGTAYQSSCAECGATFIASDARSRYCATHATGSSRSRRSRARVRASGNSGNDGSRAPFTGAPRHLRRQVRHEKHAVSGSEPPSIPPV